MFPYVASWFFLLQIPQGAQTDGAEAGDGDLSRSGRRVADPGNGAKGDLCAGPPGVPSAPPEGRFPADAEQVVGNGSGKTVAVESREGNSAGKFPA